MPPPSAARRRASTTRDASASDHAAVLPGAAGRFVEGWKLRGVTRWAPRLSRLWLGPPRPALPGLWAAAGRPWPSGAAWGPVAGERASWWLAEPSAALGSLASLSWSSPVSSMNVSRMRYLKPPVIAFGPDLSPTSAPSPIAETVHEVAEGQCVHRPTRRTTVVCIVEPRAVV